MEIIRVSKPSLEQIKQVKPLLEKTDYKPYRFLRSEREGGLISFWLNDLADLFSRNGGEMFCASEGSKILGMIVYADLPWETRIFARKMGTLKYTVVDPCTLQKNSILEELLEETIDWAVGTGIEFLLCKTYSDDMTTIHSLEKHGFLLMDTLLDYVYDFRSFPLHTVAAPRSLEDLETRAAESSDLDELMTVAHASFQHHFGRFHADERISREHAVRVYEEWIKSSCAGYADWVLVAKIAGRIAGYSVWRKPTSLELALKTKLGHYSIGAVHPDYYGRGFFSVLTFQGMKLFQGLADCIEGPTHVNNYQIQRAYDKLHWRVRDARHSFHKWLTL